MTDEQKALQLADWLQGLVRTYDQVCEDEPGGYLCEDDEAFDASAAMLRKLVAEREEHRAAMRRALEAALHVTDCATRNEHGELVLLGSLYNPEHLDAAITDLRQRLEGTA